MAQPAQPLPKHTEPVPLNAPSLQITNGLIAAKIYVPDFQKGFYRGTRFDQSGVIGSLILGKQDFYGPWFDRVSSEVADFAYTPEGIVGGPDSAISGPVDEFAPIGFDQAKPGETFIKIGVGLLKKPDAAPYDHYHLYEIADAGVRSVLNGKDSVTFTQDVTGAYRYVKTLRLVPGKPELVIAHELTNKSGTAFVTTAYDHNFLKLSPGNENVVVRFPFTPKPDKKPDAGMAKIDGKRILYVRSLKDKDVVSFLIKGYGKNARDYDFHVDNTKTGAGVRVVGDQPLVKLNLWSIRTVMAVEPYVGLEVPPGATRRWSYTYTYKAP